MNIQSINQLCDNFEEEKMFPSDFYSVDSIIVQKKTFRNFDIYVLGAMMLIGRGSISDCAFIVAI